MKNIFILVLLILPCLLYGQKRLGLNAGYAFPKLHNTGRANTIIISTPKPSYLIDVSFQHKKRSAIYPKFSFKYQNSNIATFFNYGINKSNFEFIEINMHSFDFAFLVEYVSGNDFAFFVNFGPFFNIPILIKQSGFTLKNTNQSYYSSPNMVFYEFNDAKVSNHTLSVGFQGSSGIITDLTNGLSMLLYLNYTNPITNLGGIKINTFSLNFGLSQIIG